ncbi:hypothetical protein DPEC_G00286710, partial [Dallia pectoralis]
MSVFHVVLYVQCLSCLNNSRLQIGRILCACVYPVICQGQILTTSNTSQHSNVI